MNIIEPHGPAEPRIDVGGLILAGGRSTRFGRDKATSVVDGKPMIARVFEVLSPLVRQVLISVRFHRDDLPLEARQIEDRYPGAGPLAGLHSGLIESDNSHVLVLASDLPYVTAEVLRHIRDAPAEADVPVVARTPDGRLQPLCALYPRTMLQEVEEHLEAGRLAMHALLEACAAVQVVDAPFEVLRNVNRPLQD